MGTLSPYHFPLSSYVWVLGVVVCTGLLVLTLGEA